MHLRSSRIHGITTATVAAFFASMLVACSQSVSAPKEDRENAKGDQEESEDPDELPDDCEGEADEPWDGTTAKDFACGAGTKQNPYIILNAEQLARLSFAVGDGDKKYNSKYYKLGADILLNKGEIIDSKGKLTADSAKLHKWTPIGNATEKFSGTFDGDGHTISGIFINTTSSHNGLFGNVSGTVQNLTVENGWVKGGSYTAGIIGLNVGTVKNVSSSVTVTGSDDCSGGVIGNSNSGSYYSDNSIVKNATNNGLVTGKTNVGGVIGCTTNTTVEAAENTAKIEGETYVGGVIGGIGSSNDNNLKNLKNRGNITGTHFVGGVAGHCGGYLLNYSSGHSSAGYCHSGLSYPCGKIANAENKGSVKGFDFVAGVIGLVCEGTISSLGNYEQVEGDSVVAGVIGYIDYSTSKAMHNMESINGRVAVGGIIAFNNEGVTSSAYNAGSITGDSLVGLVIGRNYNSTIADYYYKKQNGQEPFGENDGGGTATPKTGSEMKTEEFAELLGEEFEFDEEENSGYPVLKTDEE